MVPGGGLSIDGKRWVHSHHKTQRRRRKPYLVDNKLLSCRFREKFIASLKRLHGKGKIRFTPPQLPGEYALSFDEWADRLAMRHWCVYIEPPPEKNSKPADPKCVLKYLAHYMSGGPISDQRLISHDGGQVTFWARSKNKQTGNKPQPFTLPGREFVRRWAMHILPKGFTRSRAYGGFSNHHRKNYLRCCRALLKLSESGSEPAEPDPMTGDQDETEPEPTKACPHCQRPMVCTGSLGRPSWRDLLTEYATCPLWYQPWVSYGGGWRIPAAEP